MKKVMAFGTFAIIHPGHITYLEEARKLGDYLVVVVARDRTVERLKGKCIIPEDQRLLVVSKLKPVDKAILGYKEDMFKVIEEERPDIIALGPDQPFREGEILKELEKRGLSDIKVVRIRRFENKGLNKSSKILKIIRDLG